MFHIISYTTDTNHIQKYKLYQSVTFLFLLAQSDSSDKLVKVKSPTVELCFFPLTLFLIPVSLAFFDFDFDFEVEIKETMLANDSSCVILEVSRHDDVGFARSGGEPNLCKGDELSILTFSAFSILTAVSSTSL